mgnify:FL=1
MTPKRFIFRAIVRSMEWIVQQCKPAATCHLPLEPQNGKGVDIITVAFNNVELIKYQTLFLQKFIRDSYTRIIVDNSTDRNKRKELYRYCLENNIAYIGLPKNLLNKIGCSYSHAMALNYTWKHVIMQRRPFAFGWLDHDLFPTRPVSILKKLAHQPIYGPLRQRGDEWYLSAIMSFFQFSFVHGKRFDCMPVIPSTEYLDSGGGNWYSLYSHLNRDTLVFPTECIEYLREGNDRYSDCLEFFDDKLWLHTINGSLYKVVHNNEKNNLVKQRLDRILHA